ncbi:glycosyltransferase family 9 protein [Massilia sp. IC2-477]|uniref:glycosyltransferase family 9 protein n=1 Tax=Massilia sp. IC2-477 TaxID=2887198 RepID=UPI001D0FFE10|nr:glycosyltransferase family 9 protein [Massilia sp. IC2-477]MCC2955969.1 glycosyltransferase family 9 protein [Massilia sp. IC2-477]
MSAAWQSARRILCIRLDSLGDVLMCTPAIRALRQSIPGCELTLLTSPSGAAVTPYIPELNGAISYRAPWMKHEELASSAALQECAAQLAAQRFDAAVIFTSYSQSPLPAAMLCHLAGIPLRLASSRENPYQLLSHWVPEHEHERATRHEVQRQLDLVAHVGCSTSDTTLSFAIPQEATASVAAILIDAGIDPDAPYLVLHAGASAASRRYPVRHWLVLIGMLGTHFGYPIILTGDRGDVESLRPLSDTWVGPSHSLIGKLNLGELGALIRSSSLLITGNTGPAHIAAAVGTPLVDMYALTNPQHTPWRVAHRLLFHDVSCRNCLRSSCPQGHHACLDLLAPRKVLEAAVDLLAAGAPRPARTDDIALAFE